MSESHFMSELTLCRNYVMSELETHFMSELTLCRNYFMSELTLWWNYFMADSNFRDLQKSATLWWYFLYVGISYHFMGELLYAEMNFQRIAKTHYFMVGLTLW